MIQEEQIKENIKENIVRYREANGLTGDDVAEALGINAATYRSWETGRSAPKYPAIVKLARIYNVTVDMLLYNHKDLANYNSVLHASDSNSYVYGDDYMSQLTNSEKVIMMKIRQLNQEDKIKLSKFLKELLK